MNRDQIQRLSIEARQHHQAGRLKEAEGLYRQILAVDRFDADTLHLLGLVQLQSGDPAGAAQTISRAISINSANPAYHGNLGLAYKALGDLDQTIAAFTKAAALRPDVAEAHFNLGAVLQERGRLQEAIAAYQRCLALRPNFPEALNNLGNVLRMSGAAAQSRAALEQAVKLRPDFVEAWNNLGLTCEEQGDLSTAAAMFQRSLSLRPQFAGVQNNFGCLLVRCAGLFGDGIPLLRQSVAQSPESAEFHSALLYALHYGDDISPQALFEEHRQYASKHAMKLAPKNPPAPTDRSNDRPLRVGYLSADLMEHPIAHFLEPILEHHDRGAATPIIFSSVRRPDEVTSRLRRHLPPQDWHDVLNMTDAKVAQHVREQRIDILVDLGGHTQHNRLLVFAHQPAPVQVTYMGYPNTTGLPRSMMAYRLTDAHCDLPKADALHTERLYRLPRTFLCYEPSPDAPDVGPLPCLQSGTITFGSLNNPTKITRRMLKTWADMLLAVPNSRLMLKGKVFADAAVREQLWRVLSEMQVGRERVTLMGPKPLQAEHLACYREIDIALDTFPYHGTTTTCDAMWMGVPVITLAGEVHLSRVGVSLLRNVGLPELIADSPEQYIRIAIDLAKDSSRLQQLRGTLRQRMRVSPICDAKPFVRDLEAAYRNMWAAQK